MCSDVKGTGWILFLFLAGILRFMHTKAEYLPKQSIYKIQKSSKPSPEDMQFNSLQS